MAHPMDHGPRSPARLARAVHARTGTLSGRATAGPRGLPRASLLGHLAVFSGLAGASPTPPSWGPQLLPPRWTSGCQRPPPPRELSSALGSSCDRGGVGSGRGGRPAVPSRATPSHPTLPATPPGVPAVNGRSAGSSSGAGGKPEKSEVGRQSCRVSYRVSYRARELMCH